MKASFPFGEIVKSTRMSGTWEETRQRGAGKKGELSFFSHPFQPTNARPPTHAARSLARSRLASLVQMESSLSGCLRRRRMFITEEAWSRARQHQANSTDDITSELSEKDWEPAWGSTIDKRHAWLRISEKGDALAELFVCLFVFDVPVARRHRLSLGPCND